MSRHHWLVRTLAATLFIALAACQASPAAPAALSTPPTTAPSGTAAAPSLQSAPVPFSESTLAVRQEPGSDHHLLVPVDPATGVEVQGYEPINMGSNFFYTFSPDRKTMIFSSLAESAGSFAALRFLNLETWTQCLGWHGVFYMVLS